TTSAFTSSYRNSPRRRTVERSALLDVAKVGRGLHLLQDHAVRRDLLDDSLAAERDHQVIVPKPLNVAHHVSLVLSALRLVRPVLADGFRSEVAFDLDHRRAVARAFGHLNTRAGDASGVVVEDQQVVEAEDLDAVLASEPDVARERRRRPVQDPNR